MSKTFSAIYLRFKLDQKSLWKTFGVYLRLKLLLDYKEHKFIFDLTLNTLQRMFLTLEIIFMHIRCNLEFLEKIFFFGNFDPFLPLFDQIKNFGKIRPEVLNFWQVTYF